MATEPLLASVRFLPTPDDDEKRRNVERPIRDDEAQGDQTSNDRAAGVDVERLIEEMIGDRGQRLVHAHDVSEDGFAP